MRSAAVILGVIVLGTGSHAVAEIVTYDLPEETAILKPGPGIDQVQSNCLACHSADYIAMQPPKRGKAFWDAEVTKMIKTYGAPIGEAKRTDEDRRAADGEGNALRGRRASLDARHLPRECAAVSATNTRPQILCRGTVPGGD